MSADPTATVEETRLAIRAWIDAHAITLERGTKLAVDPIGDVRRKAVQQVEAIESTVLGKSEEASRRGVHVEDCAVDSGDPDHVVGCFEDVDQALGVPFGHHAVGDVGHCADVLRRPNGTNGPGAPRGACRSGREPPMTDELEAIAAGSSLMSGAPNSINGTLRVQPLPLPPPRYWMGGSEHSAGLRLF